MPSTGFCLICFFVVEKESFSIYCFIRDVVIFNINNGKCIDFQKYQVLRVFLVQMSVVDRGRHGGTDYINPTFQWSPVTGGRWGRSWVVVLAIKDWGETVQALPLQNMSLMFSCLTLLVRVFTIYVILKAVYICGKNALRHEPTVGKCQRQRERKRGREILADLFTVCLPSLMFWMRWA